MLTLRIGTRPSPLAVKQVVEINIPLPSAHFEIVKIDTEGDRNKTTPLDRMEGTDFFTRDIEDALLEGRIDAAVHSAKDLEDSVPEGLVIAATTRSISPYDCLVSRSRYRLKTLPARSIIGTSSRNRKEAILKYRKDLLLRDIRGNTGERLERLDRGEFDAIIVAHAALIRLGREDHFFEVIPEEIIKPHPLQGRLAVQVRKDRQDLLNLFRGINDK